MDLESISSSASNLAQTAAILVGGGWAYMKFLRGRTFGSRALLDLTADSYQYRGDPVLLVHVSMHNEGLSKIDISAPNEKFVRVDAIFSDTWSPDMSVAWDDDENVVSRAFLFETHGWIEPNETIDDHLLIPVAAPDRSDPVAYRVRARVTQPPRARWPRKPRKTGQTWSAVRIVPLSLTSDDAAASAKPTPKGEADGD